MKICVQNVQDTTHSGIHVCEAAYKTIVRPQLEYASTTWSPYTKKDIYKVKMVQRRLICWICNSFSNYDSVTANLGLGTGQFFRYDIRIDTY